MAQHKKSTVRYAAKQAYQLCLMTGKQSMTCCKLWCHVVFDPYGNVVLVYDADTHELVASVPIAKAWASL